MTHLEEWQVGVVSDDVAAEVHLVHSAEGEDTDVPEVPSRHCHHLLAGSRSLDVGVGVSAHQLDGVLAVRLQAKTMEECQ